MNIAVFTDYYLPTIGGIQTSIKAQKESLEAAGHRVKVFTPRHIPSKDPSIIRLPTLKYIKPDGFPVAGTAKNVIKSAKNELNQLRPDLVHVHSDMAAGVAGLIAAKELGIPTVQSMHGREDVYAHKILPLPDLTSYYFAWLHSRYISHKNTNINLDGHNTKNLTARRMWKLMVSHANYADHVIVPSQHFSKRLKDHGVIKPLSVISNGLEDSVVKDIGSLEPRQYSKNEKLRIMWCGRLSPEKRPLEFLESIKLYPNNIVVDIYGDGLSMKTLRRFIAKNDFHKKVRLHGAVKQSEVIEAMKQHHVFVSSTYDFDNQPMVLLEAVATGLPVIYCDPDLGEFIPKDGSKVTGSPSPTAIADQIIFLYEHPENIKVMSEAMLAYTKNITQSTHINMLIDTYSAIINNKTGCVPSKQSI